MTSNVDTVEKPFDRRQLLKKSKSSKRFGSFGESCRSMGMSLRNIFGKGKENIVERKSKRVSFDTIEIREHNMTLGDNPSCSHGPPLAMEWGHSGRYEMSLDDYEENRGERRRDRQLAIPRHQREFILKKKGVTRSEMNDVIKENMVIRRENSNDVKKYLSRQRLICKAKKIIPVFIRRRGSSNKERHQEEQTRL